MMTRKYGDGGEVERRIVGGAMSLTVSTLIVKFLGLIYKIPLANVLGDLGMGYFNSAYTVFAFFYLLCTAGVPKAIMIHISEAKADKKGIDESKIVAVSIKLFCILGLIITQVFMIFSAPLAALIGNGKSAFTMLFVAPSILFVSLSGVIRGYLNANLKLIEIAVSQIIEGVGKLAFGLIFAAIGKRLDMPLYLLSAMTVLGVTLGAICGFIYLFICSKIKIKELKVGQNAKEGENRAIVKRIFSISIPITVSAAIMSLTGLIDLALIMRSLLSVGYCETDASALYGNYTTLAVPMLNLALSILSPISVAYLPMFTKAIVSGNITERSFVQKASLELSATLSAPMMIGLMIFSREILSLLFPRSELSLGSQLLFALAPAIFFSSLTVMVNTMLEASGRVKAPMISMLFGCIAKIFVSSYLITRTDLGILGAPVGTVVCYAVSLMVSIIIYSKEFGEMLPIVSTHILKYISALIAVLTAKYLYLRLLYIFEERILLVASILFAGIVYLALLAFISLLSPKSRLKVAIYTKKRA